MSNEPPAAYRLDYTVAAKEQLQSAAGQAAQDGKLPELVAILKKAIIKMRTDPHGWGDPEYQALKGTVYHGLLRPAAFRYVVYEQVQAVVLLEVRVYADFA